MKNTIKSLLALAIIGASFSCSKFDNEVGSTVVSQGTADFSTYVALGNSLTAGYQDGTVYRSGQANSYPAIMAGQLQLAGGSADFKQPYVKDDNGGLLAGGVQISNTKLELQIINGALAPVPVSATPTTDVVLGAIGANGPYQNLGVSGARVSHLLANGYGNAANLSAGLANPYFVYSASSPNASVIEDAMVQNPTFFSLWIGNNDVLGYATSGGDGSSDITNPTAFKGAYDMLIAKLTENGAKGVIANIPNITTIPFFTTVPYNALSPEALGADTITALNQNFGGFNAALNGLVTMGAISQEEADKRKVTFSTDGASSLLIKDEALADLTPLLNAAFQAGGLDAVTAATLSGLYGQARQTTSKDLVLLTTASTIGQPNTDAIAAGLPASLSVMGVSYPLGDSHVLTESEVAEVLDATAEFNATIADAASTKGLALADMIDLNGQLQSGLTFNGTTYTPEFVSGGAFSLDGVHLTSRGYAVFANHFIEAINGTYGSNIPTVNPNNYAGIKLP